MFSKAKSSGGTLAKFSPSNLLTVAADKVCSSWACEEPFIIGSAMTLLLITVGLDLAENAEKIATQLEVNTLGL